MASSGVTASMWASSFLLGIGAPITQNNIDNVIAWGTAESGNPQHPAHQSAGGWNNYNPLNVVVQSGDHHTSQGGSQGNIASFGNMTDGVNASARLFQGSSSGKKAIVSVLRSNGSRAQLDSAINQFYGSWGGSLHLPGVSAAAGQATIGGDIGKAGSSPSIGDRVKDAAGSVADVGGALNPFQQFATIADAIGGFVNLLQDWRTSMLYLGEILLGVFLIGLGTVVVLFDTGAMSKMPMPVPIPV